MTRTLALLALAMSTDAFAAALGVSRVTVQNWREGRNRPSPEMARKIEEVTHGGLPASLVRPDVFAGYTRDRATAAAGG